MMLKFLLAQAKRFPWITNITWYSSIFTAGDLAQQKLHNKEKVDLKQTRNVAILAFSFHGNIFYLWLRLMERMFPGTAPGNVLRKVVCDQLVITPTGVSGFYIGCYHLLANSTAHQLWFDTRILQDGIFWKLGFCVGHFHVPLKATSSQL
ncbi:mpv17-like protein isoform X2 [Chiloscyllium plagiosum]|uniref:mpv17-like protein isoform X2 n=1 Tax=Chiloscyllium plagiosum TaxID=36176 RepID=UPI001CB80682|nr:mpv17-like protein isoform X2 [Chiloscyllium plagiosum]